MLSRNPRHRHRKGEADEFSLLGQATWLLAKYPVGVYGPGAKKTDKWLEHQQKRSGCLSEGM
jgi:hypothetical protein